VKVPADYYKTLLWLLLLCFSINSHAEPLVNPFTILLEHAQKGNADAMFEVGKYYQTGEYTDQNWQECIYWYEKAIDANNTRAMLNLGRILLTGADSEVKADIPRGIQLIEQAANAGEAEAQFQLGQIFEQGKVLGHDLPSAVRWYRAAELQKYPKAREALRRSIQEFKTRGTN